MSFLVSNLEFLLNKHGINAYQLQERSDIPQSTTFRIINGDTQSPSSKTVRKYANYFNIDEVDLRYTDLSKSDKNDIKAVDEKKFRQAPVLNFTQAGVFEDYFDDALADTYEPVPFDSDPHVYWVEIEGLSMIPDFKPTELVLINPDIQPNPGDFVLALKYGEKATTFKKWRPRGFDNDGNEYSELVPSNPDFPIIDSRHTPFTVCGVAIQHKKNLR